MTRRREGFRIFLPTALVVASLWAPVPARAQGGTIVRYSMEPRVVDRAAPVPVTITLVGDQSVTSADFRFRDGTVAQLTSVGPSTFRFSLNAQQAISGYETGEIQNFVGSLRTYVSRTQTDSDGVELNIKDETMADVPITTIAADAQRSPHVANLRYDTPFDGEGSAGPVLQRFYSYFPDDFDFAAVITAQQNEVTFAGGFEGPGSNSGSAGTLEGVLVYPGDGGFDLGAYLALHELGHRWLNLLGFAPLAQNIPHWPASDLIQGVLGRGTGYFGFDLVPEGGNYRLVRGGETGFNDLELYLMGLVPPEQVGRHFVFDNQNQPAPGEGVMWSGPVTSFGISDIVASDGPQDPDYRTSQKDFRIATVVLSEGRLLTPTEMAYFDHVAARAAARKPFTVRTSSTDPWYTATGGRATLNPAFGPVPAPTLTSVAAGAAGKAVISGTELIAATEVRFGQTITEFTVDSNSRLTATVPAGITQATVTVVTPTGSASGSWGGGGPTPSPSPSATPSPEPSASGSPSPSASPSPSPSPVVSHERTLTLKVRRSPAGYIAKGILVATDGFSACSSAAEIRLESRKERGRWRKVAEKTTSATGDYALDGLPRTSRSYRTLARKTTLASGDVCSRAVSRQVSTPN